MYNKEDIHEAHEEFKWDEVYENEEGPQAEKYVNEGIILQRILEFLHPPRAKPQNSPLEAKDDAPRNVSDPICINANSRSTRNLFGLCTDSQLPKHPCFFVRFKNFITCRFWGKNSIIWRTLMNL